MRRENGSHSQVGSTTMVIRLHRLLLFVAAFGWGVSVLGTFGPWPAAECALQGLGAGPIPEDPMLDYWFRMATGAFTMIGVLFLLAGWDPSRFQNLIPPLAILMILEGLLLLVHGLRLGLRPFPFYGDTSFCISVGLGILLTRQRRGEVPEPDSVEATRVGQGAPRCS